jgi:hypothetical protein
MKVFAPSKRSWLVGASLMGLGILLAFLLLFVSSMGNAQSGNSLLVQAVASSRTASPGNVDTASLYVTVQSSTGLLEGLTASNFSVFAEQLPPQGCLVNVTQLRTQNPGVYRLDIVPGAAGCTWRAGDYVLSVTVRAASQSGAALAIMAIP